MDNFYITASGEKLDIWTSYMTDVMKGRFMYNFYYIPSVEATEMFITDPLPELYCNDNMLSSLVIPDGIEKVYCDKNQIKQLNIPLSVDKIECDLMDGIEEQYRKGLVMEIYQKR